METSALNDLAHKLNAFVPNDGQGFRRKARILQSIWREEQGYEIGNHRGEPLGSLLVADWANRTGANFLTETVRLVVSERLKPENHQPGQMIQISRLFSNLLSNQPLSFNLFGELKEDLALTSDIFREISGGRFEKVTGIEFEWSPGRGELKYTNDNSAFDVYISGMTPNGGNVFAGIEIKYHEDLKNPITRKQRYVEVAELMNCFRYDCMQKFFKIKPMHQIWRDHLMAGIHRKVDEFEDGFFVFLYPKDNYYCRNAAEAYESCLLDQDTFTAWTLERFVDVLRNHSAEKWIDRFFDRYLDFTKLEKHIA